MTAELDFQFEQFAVNIINAIDEIRSFGRESITFPIESRINALYRAIGLPAVVKSDSLQQSANNGNTFSPDSLQYEAFQDSFLIRNNSFKIEITDDEAKRFLLFNESKIGDGTKEFKDINSRQRGLLFPMVVDGEISIFPQSKRIAIAFQSEENLEVGINKYKRPLIETIILLRLKTQGVQDTTLQDKVAQDYNIDISQELNNISTTIEDTMRLVVKHIPFILGSSVKKINAAKQNTNVDFVPIIANIAQQSVLRSKTSKQIGKYDKQKIIQEEQLKSKQALLAFLEYDDTFSTDIRVSRNLKDAALASAVLSLFDPNANSDTGSKTQRDAEDTDRIIEKSTTDLRSGFRTLDLLFGTFSGISGVDVLIIIYALFRLPINVLISLLNDNAIENLIGLKGKSIANNKVDVVDAIDQLQKKVTDLYKAAEDLVGHSGKNGG